MKPLELSINPSTMAVLPTQKEKPKRKNSEKRKEKSRKAARERRSQESKIFDQIEEILPVAVKTLSHLDKASIVRIAINYLKIRSVVDPLKGPKTEDVFKLPEYSALNTLNGFVFVLSKDGDIIYLSENVESYLGLTHIDLMGQSIYDYTHPCDHDDLKLFLEPLNNAYNASRYLPKPTERARKSLRESLGDNAGPFFIRMKSTLSNKGRNLNLKSANFKVVKCTGRMIDLETASPEQAQMVGENFRHYMIAIGEMIPHPSRIENSLSSDVFMSKHSPDMKFISVGQSVEQLFGFTPKELIGTSFYKYFEVEDFKPMSDFFKTLFSKGQCDSAFYKFFVKTGGYRWISTQATLITEPNSNHPQSIILVNRVISDVEDAHLITSDVQQQSSQVANTTLPFETISVTLPEPVSATASLLKPKSSIFEVDNEPIPALANLPCNKFNEIPFETAPAPEEPVNLLSSELDVTSSTENLISSTLTVLAPKTADMESGFLMFDDNKGITVLTDADDLTHLAPDAGDLCVPMLSDNYLNDIFDEMLGTSFQGNPTEEELLNNLINMEGDKLKLNDFDSLNMENEINPKKHTSTGFLANCNKDVSSMKFNNYELSNDPFLSFGNPNEELLMSTSPGNSTGSLTDHYSSSSNSPTGSPPSGGMAHFSSKSSACDELTSSLNDSIDFDDKIDLEMRAPYIPLEDDLFLNDLTFADTNMDDLFSFISNNCSNSNSNKLNVDDGGGGGLLMGSSPEDLTKLNKVKSLPGKNSTGGCLEALLQNDDLVNDNKVCNSNNFLRGKSQPILQPALAIARQNYLQQAQQAQPQVKQQPQQQQSRPQIQPQSPLQSQSKTKSQTPMQPQRQCSMKRKNSNIVIYTTLNPGDKKFKNIVLSAEHLNAAKLAPDKATQVHHFVLTKNNELIPKPSLAEQPFKVSSKRVLPADSNATLTLGHQQHQQMNSGNTVPNDPPGLLFKEDLFLKKARQDTEKAAYSNSVLLNLLVNGADLPNGYEIIHSYQANARADGLMPANCLQ